MLPDYDIYQINELFTAEQRAIRDSTAAFVKQEYLPHIEHYTEHREFPTEVVPRLAEMGFLGTTLPETYGGAGLDYSSYGLMNLELEYGDSGLRSFISVQNGLVMYPIFSYGTEEQKKRWLPAMAAGEAIGCFGLTEPDHGSDPGSMETTVVETNDGYVLNGNKMWITNGSLAHVAVVWAKLEGKVRGFLVERGTPGFTTNTMKGKLSLLASDTSELHFQDCHIPKDNLLPNVAGLKGPLSCLNQARFGISYGVVGAALACYDQAVSYAKQRTQFDKPIGSFQIIQQRLTEMLTEITKGFLVVWRLGLLQDQGKCTPVQISFAKRNNVAMALEIARKARTILGANGIINEYHVMRHMNNLESVYTYEGTHDIHTLIVGEAITGIPAYAPHQHK
jgi:glutaryl-CoA dehydrogenase